MSRYWTPGGDVDLEKIAPMVARDAHGLPATRQRQQLLLTVLRDLEAEMSGWGELSRPEIAQALYGFAGEVKAELDRLGRSPPKVGR